jgi:AraC-like DNA-binding protein
MSVELASERGGSRLGIGVKAGALHSVVGVLDDGTPYYAPLGEVVAEGSRVICHLCGRALRSVVAHLPSHGWTKNQYCEAFGLERGQSLEGSQTHELRAALFTARLAVDPVVRDGAAAGRERAQRGELARAAASAARGRPFPEQRRRKSRRPLTGLPREAVAQANRDRAGRHLADVAGQVARSHGYPDIRAYVLARTKAGASLAAISREAGLHKDWLCRHLARIDPAAQDAVRQQSARRLDARWLPAIRALGFADVPGYLAERHLCRHLTINAIAAEVGFSNHAVKAALRRHGLPITGHAAKRHTARQRAADAAASLGYPTIAEYIGRRRAEGWTWSAIAAESGQPSTWLRRHAAG